MWTVRPLPSTLTVPSQIASRILAEPYSVILLHPETVTSWRESSIALVFSGSRGAGGSFLGGSFLFFIGIITASLTYIFSGELALKYSMPKEGDKFLKGAIMTDGVMGALKPRLGYGRVAAIVFAVGLIACAVAFPNVILGAATEAAKRFAISAFSSVLLFTAASNMLIKSGFGEVCKRATGKLIPRLFGLNGGFAAPFIIGAVAGYPLGVKTVCELYRRGECSKGEAESAFALCSVPGVGFTVAFVGGALWEDVSFGITAWISCLAGAVAVGMLGSKAVKNGSAPMRCNGDGIGASEESGFSVAAVIAESVGDAASTVLRVLAFVVFFNAVAVILWGFTAWIGVFDGGALACIRALTVPFFEFSSGVSQLASSAIPSVCLFSFFCIDGAVVARLFTVAALAWSGVSVHMQSQGFISSCGLSARRYYIGKGISVFISVCFYALTVFIAP